MIRNVYPRHVLAGELGIVELGFEGQGDKMKPTGTKFVTNAIVEAIAGQIARLRKCGFVAAIKRKTRVHRPGHIGSEHGNNQQSDDESAHNESDL